VTVFEMGDECKMAAFQEGVVSIASMVWLMVWQRNWLLDWIKIQHPCWPRDAQGRMFSIAVQQGGQFRSRNFIGTKYMLKI
jgi:hypothetical protein